MWQSIIIFDDAQAQWGALHFRRRPSLSQYHQIYQCAVAAGDVVVTAGQMKLHNGAAINIDNTVQVTNDANPAPQDR